MAKRGARCHESSADRKTRAGKIVRQLAKTYAVAECALNHKSPYELLAATILSAQCTDERVNLVTPSLFGRYPTPTALAASKPSELEVIIRSTGFFRAKAANLIGMAKGVVDRFDGEIPRTLDDLVSLPGVGRKTANVLLGTAFGIASGVVVDTHVRRITNLLGLTDSKNPEQIERDLMELLPKPEWVNFAHRLIHHGRKICIARRPDCPECPLSRLCPRIGLAPLAE